MSLDNLERLFGLADRIDLAEGELAYPRYRALMQRLSDRFDVPIERVTAAFVALSPNTDYVSNFNSTVRVLAGYRNSTPVQQIVTCGYNHCRDRAFSYVTGDVDFLKTVGGLKIRSFYYNILYPDDPTWVTVDGHISAAWRGQALTMREALIRNEEEYRDIEADVKILAFRNFMLPNVMQAIIWFTRKRVLKIRYKSQLDLFSIGDHWEINGVLNEQVSGTV